MELRHLRTIAAVARHGSFSKAAAELHLAQSAVSQQIRRLELELGIEVFRRTSRSVELTPEGEVILGYAQRVLREVDGLHSELGELTGLLRGEIRIGGMHPTGPYDLAELLAEFRRQPPGRRDQHGRGHAGRPARPAARATSWTARSPRSSPTPWATSTPRR